MCNVFNTVNAFGSNYIIWFKTTHYCLICFLYQDREDDYTMFLIAGYARYSCPYVWIRTNHERIVQFSNEDSSEEKDYPLKLKTTSSWQEKGNIKIKF